MNLFNIQFKSHQWLLRYIISRGNVFLYIRRVIKRET